MPKVPGLKPNTFETQRNRSSGENAPYNGSTRIAWICGELSKSQPRESEGESRMMVQSLARGEDNDQPENGRYCDFKPERLMLQEFPWTKLWEWQAIAWTDNAPRKDNL